MIYISGRITGNKNWEEQFHEAECYLIKKYYDEKIINPLCLDENTKKVFKTENPTYKQYMINDIKHLIKCTHIYMLRGWWRSKGARLERHIAKVFGMKIMYQKRGEK
jgi:hypothetical protein